MLPINSQIFTIRITLLKDHEVFMATKCQFGVIWTGELGAMKFKTFESV